MPAAAALLMPALPHRRPVARLWVRAPDGATGESERTQERAAAGGGSVGASGVRLLIVDDDPLMTDLLPRKLERAMVPGVRILTASSVEEAMQLIAAERPHVVLSDFNLRETKTGLDVLAEAARAAPEAARLLFSGHTLQEIGPPMQGADIHGYIEKPMRLDELVASLLDAIRGATGLDLAREGAGDASRH